MRTFLVISLISCVAASKLGGGHAGVHPPRRAGPQKASLLRDGRQIEVQGGIDFSTAELDPETGKRCILKEIEVDSLDKEPILECTHKNVEKCHYTYITKFTPTKEQICEEHFQKKCQISFKQQALNETVQKCYKPIQKVCNGEGPEECKTIFESSCTTKYIEKQPGKFVGDSKCEKLPVEICGRGCVYEEGEEECHDKVIASLVETPEEVCDLNPQKVCRFSTKLVPKLTPEHQCTIVPKETCHLKFTNPKPGKKPLLTKWCLDESEPAPGESYDESNALGEPLGIDARLDVDQQAPAAAAPAPAFVNPEPVPSQPALIPSFEQPEPTIVEDRLLASADQYEASTFAPEIVIDEILNELPEAPTVFNQAPAEAPQNFYGAPRDLPALPAPAQSFADNLPSQEPSFVAPIDSYTEPSVLANQPPRSRPQPTRGQPTPPAANAPQSFYGAPSDVSEVEYETDLLANDIPTAPQDFYGVPSTNRRIRTPRGRRVFQKRW